MKPGEHVQVTDKNAIFFGEVGTVRAIEKGGQVDVRFRGREDNPIHYDPGQVKPVEMPKPFAK